MRLNMYMIAEEIPWAETKRSFSEAAKDDCLLQAKLYSSEIPLSDRYLYLVNAEDFPPILPRGDHFHFVVLGGGGSFQYPESCEIIFLNTDDSLLMVFDILQKCFEWYNIWEESLVEILNSDADIQKMCEASRKIFVNPVIAHNGSYEVMGTSVSRKVMEEDLDFPYHENIGAYVASSNYLEYFKSAKVFHDTMDKKGVENYHAGYPAQDVLYVNLAGGDAGFPGRLILPELYCQNTYSTYPPLAQLGKIISFALNRRTILERGSRRSMERLLGNLIQGSVVNGEEGKLCLQTQKWRPDDTFCCILLSLSESDRRIYSVSYSCQRLEETMESCFAFPHEDTIVGVCRFPGKAEDLSTVGTSFGSFLRDGFFKAGISNMYDNIYQTQIYYEQAKAALKVGSECDPEIWYYPFRKYAFRYLIHYGMGKFDPQFFVDQRIFALRNMDKREEVDYYNTLKVYLENNMNLLHSAEELFIHRTTLFYRINRIKETLGLDLSDKKTRLSLLMSFYILEQLGMR